uniref:Protein kinase domain-containing protein n=1 Tax=Panagrolaimus sp. ES5 TaxID=591445 RepID=A0AC34FEZ4_9BILA
MGKLNILSIFVILVLVNVEGITYRAKNVETLVIFSFANKANESENVANYLDYFTEHDLCNVIGKFLALPRDPLTKLNLVVFSNICPDSSIFEEFHAIDDGKILTKTYLVTKATEGCISDKSILTKQFIPEADFNIVDPNDQEESTKAENYLIVLIKKENKAAAIKFIADYYNGTTNCEFTTPTKVDEIKPFFITLVMKDENRNSNELTTVIPAIDFNEANFTFKEYLIHNLEYELKNSKNNTSFDIATSLSTYNNDPQQLAIFTDDYNYLKTFDSGSWNKENRTINYILYLTSENQTLKENLEKTFYRDETDKYHSTFHIMTPTKNGDAFGENICYPVVKATPFKLLWWHWALIGVGIFLFLSGCTVFYRKCIRQQDPYDIIRNNPPVENKEEFLKEVDKLRVNGKFSVNFNVIKGQGVSSTVYEAIIKRCLLPEYPRRSFDNNISEDCIVAAKILNQDVAARNILISPYGDNETYTAKIADFGLCVNVDETTKEFQAPSNKGLPLKICAIECHFDRIYSEASDIWAFGLLMIEVYSLSATLYPGIGTIELPEKLKSGKRMPKPDRMSQDIYEIAFGCWKEDPNLRKPFYKLSKELKAKLREIDPENYAYKDYWHLQIEDEELMESFIPQKVKTK